MKSQFVHQMNVCAIIAVETCRMISNADVLAYDQPMSHMLSMIERSLPNKSEQLRFKMSICPQWSL